MSANNEDHKTHSKVAKVDLSKLSIDPSYQRVPSPTLVDWIEQNWDVVSSELLLVSDRGLRPDYVPDLSDEETAALAQQGTPNVQGGLWLVNGQHRSIAARRKGIKSLDARIIDLSNEVDPAKIEARYRLNTNVGLRDRATERFKAQIRAGDEESVAIVKVLAYAQTFIEFNPANPADAGGLTCIATIEQIYRADHTGALLSNALELVRDSFGGFEEKAGTSSMLKAMAWFLVANYDQSDHHRLIEQLRGVGAAALDRRARTIQGTMSGSLWFNYYRAIVDAYNERLTDARRLEWVSRGAKTLGGKARGGSGDASN